MARNLQEALLEVQDDLRRLGLEIKGENDRKRARRKRQHKRSASSRPTAPSGQPGR